jgi:hypothetical protein
LTWPSTEHRQPCAHLRRQRLVAVAGRAGDIDYVNLGGAIVQAPRISLVMRDPDTGQHCPDARRRLPRHLLQQRRRRVRPQFQRDRLARCVALLLALRVLHAEQRLDHVAVALGPGDQPPVGRLRRPHHRRHLGRLQRGSDLIRQILAGGVT